MLLVSVHCAGHPHVFTVPAPVGSLAGQHDQIHELRAQVLIGVGLRTGSGMTLKGGSALSGDRRCEPVGPGRILDPLMVVVAALACRFCHGSDHPVRGTWIFY
ncbi:hypothetical protein CF54_33640 [Streptomyces sp. Tu 6176]|nr:hypothetical protein CF54_33640 [Streptomyces sp. Tu 6176]